MMVVSQIREIINKEGVCFVFYGSLSQSFINFFLETIGEQFKQKGIEKNLSKAVTIIAIEQIQNIMNYSQEEVISSIGKCRDLGMIVVGYDYESQRYYVNGSNEIDPENRTKIITRIDEINLLDNQAQRKLLRQKLKSGEDAHNKGAGVGFVEMAKRSSAKLQYEFDEIDGKIYFNILTFV